MTVYSHVHFAALCSFFFQVSNNKKIFTLNSYRNNRDNTDQKYPSFVKTYLKERHFIPGKFTIRWE